MGLVSRGLFPRMQSPLAHILAPSDDDGSDASSVVSDTSSEGVADAKVDLDGFVVPSLPSLALAAQREFELGSRSLQRAAGEDHDEVDVRRSLSIAPGRDFVHPRRRRGPRAPLRRPQASGSTRELNQSRTSSEAESSSSSTRKRALPANVSPVDLIRAKRKARKTAQLFNESRRRNEPDTRKSARSNIQHSSPEPLR